MDERQPEQLTRLIFPTVYNAVSSFITERKARRLSHRTIQFYQEELDSFLIYLAPFKIEAVEHITPDDIRGYLVHLGERGRNDGGVHAGYRSIRAFINWYEEEYEPDNWKNPIKKVKLGKTTIQPLPGIPIADVYRMHDVCRGSNELRDKAMILTLADTGARAAEFINLDLTDIDLITGKTIIRRGKGGKPRAVNIGRTSKKAIRMYLKTRSDNNPALWINIYSERLKLSGLYSLINRYSKAAGLSKVPGLHDFRRCAAIQWYRAGIDVITISRLLGHSSLEVTKRYLRFETVDIERVISPVDGFRR